MSVETVVTIPACNERFLRQTVEDVIEHSTEACQVVAVLDGYWPPDEDIVRHDRVHYIHHGERVGMRACINAGVALADSLGAQYVMKLDAHCMVSQDFDRVLASVCQPNWVCIPTRKRLDAENWCVKEDGRPDINYQFIDPTNDGLNGKEWRQKNFDRSLDGERIADAISCQGSCYFLPRQLYHDLGLLDEEHYGTFRKDPQEVMFKTWTSGGRCVRVKGCWYAHLHKGKRYGRMYRLDRADYRKGDEYVRRWWTDSAWDERQVIPLRQIFRRFPDMPGWADHPWMQDETPAAVAPVAGRADGLISICIPNMNRTDDLRRVMPALIQAANACPPVEVVVLDYNSSDGCGAFCEAIQQAGLFVNGGMLTYRRYEGRDHYHMAHARNLSVMASHGDYVLISCADIAIGLGFIEEIRERIGEGCVWTHGSERFIGVMCIQREEFIAAGGFDERFEYYGKEDKDLRLRLERRGAQSGAVSDAPLSLIYTPWPEKLTNYAPGVGRRKMHTMSKALYEENIANGVLVANEGKEWGQWA